MTERGLPIVDGAPACPFVAFDDDRDERATSPDHRHRCYAESPPAPRALAHQEAYCLSSAFPVCPTFQDWARREAARARDGEPSARDEEDEVEPVVLDRPPRRPGTAWSAPPPWLRGDSGQGVPGRAGQGAGFGDEGSDELARQPGFFAEAGLAAGAAAAAGASGLPATPQVEPEGLGGLSGSFADRLASGQGAEAMRDMRPEEPAQFAGPASGAPGEPTPAPPGALPSRHRERWEAGGGRDEEGHERDARAPSWERPRRLARAPNIPEVRTLPATGIASDHVTSLSL